MESVIILRARYYISETHCTYSTFKGWKWLPHVYLSISQMKNPFPISNHLMVDSWHNPTCLAAVLVQKYSRCHEENVHVIFLLFYFLFVYKYFVHVTYWNNAIFYYINVIQLGNYWVKFDVIIYRIFYSVFFFIWLVPCFKNDLKY